MDIHTVKDAHTVCAAAAMLDQCMCALPFKTNMCTLCVWPPRLSTCVCLPLQSPCVALCVGRGHACIHMHADYC